MFCPRCGQERISEATSFCSKCGFLLTGAAELLERDGALTPVESKVDSPRARGVKLGLFMLLSIFVIGPIIGMISTFVFRIEPWPMGIAVFLLGGGGFLRIAYALMFESKAPATSEAEGLPLPNFLKRGRRKAKTSDVGDRELTAGTARDFMPPAGGNKGAWLDTNDLHPHSVTDNTTKLLEKDSEKNH